MNNDNEKASYVNTVKEILVKAVIKKANYYNIDTVITEDTMLKAEINLTVYDLGDILVDLFNEIKWISGYGNLIKWFAENDCSIKELASQVEYIKTHYKE